jgi:AraC-like DNA-binding protein
MVMNAHPDKASLVNYLNERKPFLNKRYSLEQLAMEVGMPRHRLSSLINREFGMNFNRLMNRFRVEHMKTIHMGPDKERYTLEAISRECGFNSRNSFIKNFKQVCGSTPSDYFRSASRPLGNREDALN